METALQLVESNPDAQKSAVMARAAELRDAGYDKSVALSMAWDDILSDSYEEEEDDELDLDMMPRARRNPTGSSQSVSNPSGGLAMGFLMVIGGYLGWCALKYNQTKKWSWTPWKAVPVARVIKQMPERSTDGLHQPLDYNSSETVALLWP